VIHSKEKMKLNVILEEDGGVLDEIVVSGYRHTPQQKSNTASSRAFVQNSKSKRKRNKSQAFYSARPRVVANPKVKNSSQKENALILTKAENTSTFSIDVDRASYSSIRNYINNEQLPPQAEVRVEEMINYFHYKYELPKNDEPIAVQTQLTDCPWNPDSKLLHLGLQGAKIKDKNLPVSNFVFLIDVSGSMSQANKLPLLKESFLLLLNNLRPEDRVAIVTYAGYSALVLPSTSASEKEKIIESLNTLGTGGGTAGAQGIRDAYKIASKNFIQDGNNRVILATDGDFNIGISDDDQLVKLIEEKRNSGIYLSVLGFGMGNYKDGKMQKLANKGNGNHAYIDNIKEAKKVFIQEF
jgi:Ca-activated chloride channel family protein